MSALVELHNTVRKLSVAGSTAIGIGLGIAATVHFGGSKNEIVDAIFASALVIAGSVGVTAAAIIGAIRATID